MNTKRFKINVLIGGILFTVLLITGQTALTSSKKENEKKILIGASVALTGKYARPGQEQLNGFTLWMEEVNARGGLLGRKVRLLHYDDESNPKKSAGFYRKLITVDKVDLLIGPYSSGLTLTASTVAEEYNFPMLAAGAASNKIWGRGLKNVFGVNTPAASFFDQILVFAGSKGLKKVAVLYADTAFPRTVIKGAMTKAAKHGLKIVVEEKYPKAAKDFASIIAKIKAAGPEVILGGTYLPDSEAFVRQARKYGLHAKIFAFTVGPTLPEFGKDLGGDAEGVMSSSPWEPTLSFPGAREFVGTYEKRHGYKPGAHAGIGYGVGSVLEAAVKKAGSLNKDKLRKAFSSLKTTTAFGSYRVDKTGIQIAKTNYIVQWIGGQKHIVLPANLATHAIVYPFKQWAER